MEETITSVYLIWAPQYGVIWEVSGGNIVMFDIVWRHMKNQDEFIRQFKFNKGEGLLGGW